MDYKIFDPNCKRDKLTFSGSVMVSEYVCQRIQLGLRMLQEVTVPLPTIKKIQCPPDQGLPCVVTVTWTELFPVIENGTIPDSVLIVLGNSTANQTYEVPSSLLSYDIDLDETLFEQNSNITVWVGLFFPDDNSTLYSENTTFLTPGIPIVNGILNSTGRDMITPTAISVNLTNITVANDPIVTPMEYVLQYSADEGSSWEVLTNRPLTQLPSVVNLTDGLTSGKLHYFKLMVSNRFGITYSPVLKVTGCKEPQTAPGKPVFSQYNSSRTDFYISWDAPTDDGGAKIDNYTVVFQNWRSSDEIYSQEFSCLNNFIDIIPNVLGFEPISGYEYRVYITASFNGVGMGPGQSEYAQFSIPNAPKRMTLLGFYIEPKFISIQWNEVAAGDNGQTLTPIFIKRYALYVNVSNEWVIFGNHVHSSWQAGHGHNYANSDNSVLPSGKEFNFKLVPYNWFAGDPSVYSTGGCITDTEPDPLQSFALKTLTPSSATFTYALPLFDGRDPITQVIMSWDQFNGTWASFNITPTDLAYTFTYMGGEPFPLNTTVSFSAHCLNGVGNSTISNITVITYDLPRNVSQPFVDIVEEQMIRINWTNVNKYINGPMTHYLVRFKQFGTTNWANLTSAQTPSTTLQLYFEHNFNFPKKSHYQYQVCPVNVVGVGPCSEPLNVYTLIETNIASAFPKVVGKQGGNSSIKSVSFNNARDAFAIGWQYHNLTVNHAIFTLYRGDRYAPEWEKVLSDTTEISAIKHSPDGLKLVVMMINSEFVYLHATNGTVIRSFKFTPLESGMFLNSRNLWLTNSGGSERIFISYSTCGDGECSVQNPQVVMYNIGVTLDDVYRGQAQGSSVLILQDQVDPSFHYLFVVGDNIDFHARNIYDSTQFYSYVCQNCGVGNNVIASTTQINETDKVVVMVDEGAQTYLTFGFTGEQENTFRFKDRYRFNQSIISSVDFNLGIQAVSLSHILHLYQSGPQVYLAKLDLLAQTISLAFFPTVYQTYLSSPTSQAERQAIFMHNSQQFLFLKHGQAFQFPQIQKSSFFQEQVGMLYSFDTYSNCQFYGDNQYKDGDPQKINNGALINANISFDGFLQASMIDFSPVTQSVIANMEIYQKSTYFNTDFQINDNWCSLTTQYETDAQFAQITKYRYLEQLKRKVPIQSHIQKCKPNSGGYGTNDEEPQIEVRQANGSSVPQWISYNINTFKLILSNQSWQEELLEIIIRGKCSNRQVIFERQAEIKWPGPAPYFEPNMTELVVVPFNKSFSFYIPKLICENLLESITFVESGTQFLPSEFSFNNETMKITFFSNNLRVKRDFDISIIVKDELQFVTNITFAVHVDNHSPYFQTRINTSYIVFYNTTQKIEFPQMLDKENSPVRIACEKPPYIDCSSGLYIFVNAMNFTSVGNYSFNLNLTDEMDPLIQQLNISILAPIPSFTDYKFQNQNVSLFKESLVPLSEYREDYRHTVYVSYYLEGKQPLPDFLYTIGNELYAFPKIEHIGEYKLEVYLYTWHCKPNVTQMNITILPLPPLNEELQGLIDKSQNIGYPEFTTELSDIVVDQCNITKYALPSFTDADNDTVTIHSVNFGKAVKFSSFINKTNTILFYPKSLDDSKGSPYTVSITLQDDNHKYPLQKTYLMKLTIKNPQDASKQPYQPCIVDPKKVVYNTPTTPGNASSLLPAPQQVKPIDVRIKMTRINQEGRVSIRVQPPIEEIMSKLNESNIKVVNTKKPMSPLNYTIVELDQSSGYIYLMLNYTDIANLSIIVTFKSINLRNLVTRSNRDKDYIEI
ncbi:hypothetical protein FGO68_gene12279 [Halteria grandinella]|uniref:Fibronectin type-III domain-containing protein n=1 Tax=Halteria grandinella TaxID=5974 RepID=A0A8J8SXR6_HALGN|nr:hypothetical protein FGO68_gene12279 [Halteria grandinella]